MMRGVIEKRKNGFLVRVNEGTTPEGKKVYKSASGFSSFEGAREALSRMVQLSK